MSSMRLDYAGELYDRTWALKDGSVKPQGIDLNYLVFRVPGLFRRMAKYQEFPSSEMSLSVQAISTANLRGSAPFVAIPVFPSRVFRHGFIFVGAKSRLADPRELEGKRVGLPDYSSTANIWVRGFLQHDYGVDLGKVTWVTAGTAKAPVSRDLDQRVRMVQPPSGSTLEGMLGSGEIDALVSPELPAGMRAGGSMKRLIPNYRDVEKEFFRKTGIFPIMHTVVIRKDVFEASRWVADSLRRAFEEAKAASYARVAEGEFGVLPYSYAWLVSYHEYEREVLGPDPFKYGLHENKKLLDTFLDYCFEQHLLDRRPEAEELFATGST